MSALEKIFKLLSSVFVVGLWQGVYHCGYHSEKSFAATSYFITRPEGNILVDRWVFVFSICFHTVYDLDVFLSQLNCEAVVYLEIRA